MKNEKASTKLNSRFTTSGATSEARSHDLKIMRPSKDIDPSHRLSMRIDDGKGPSRVSTQLHDGLPKSRKSFANLKKIGTANNWRDECGY